MMKKIVIFGIFILFTDPLRADDEILLTRQAEAYYQAKEYTNAIDLLNKIVDETMQPWQKERLLYNIGTIYLEQEEWQKAAEQYAEITRLSEQSYLLARALKTNQAILYFRQGINLLNQGSHLTLDDYSKTIYLFIDSLTNIKEAQKAQCHLEIFLGGTDCENSVDLVDLHSAVKRAMAITLDKYGEAKIESSPVKEGVPFLLSGVNLALSDINFLESKELDDSLRGSYLTLFSRDMDSWLSLWDAQLAQLDSLDVAYHDFKEGVLQMNNQKLEESRIAFLSCEASLSDLIHSLWGMDPWVKLIQNLLTDYQRTLVQVPIQVSTLYQLQTEQNQVEESAKKSDMSLEELTHAAQALGKSLDFAKQGKTTESSFFLNQAKQSILILLRKKTEIKKEPKQILVDAIEDQTYAITLFRLSQNINKQSELIDLILRDSQQSTMKTVEPFLSSVLAKETLDFPKSCQCKPWDQVIPLFEKGRVAAKEAMQRVHLRQKVLPTMILQENALKFWREALEKLKHPEQGSTESPQQNQPPPPSNPNQQPQSTDQVLKLIQQMDQEDQLPNSTEQYIQQGERPW